MAKDITILMSSMYSRGLYEAIEAYADDRKDRTKYDAILEAAAITANAYLANLTK